MTITLLCVDMHDLQSILLIFGNFKEWVTINEEPKSKVDCRVTGSNKLLGEWNKVLSTVRLRMKTSISIEVNENSYQVLHPKSDIVTVRCHSFEI